MASCGATLPRAMHMRFFSTKGENNAKENLKKKKKIFATNTSLFFREKQPQVRSCVILVFISIMYWGMEIPFYFTTSKLR